MYKLHMYVTYKDLLSIVIVMDTTVWSGPEKNNYSKFTKTFSHLYVDYTTK